MADAGLAPKLFRCSLGSSSPLQCARELAEMVVVVPGHDREEAVERDPAEDWMESALLPLNRRQLAEYL